jgi:uncharacterized protein YcsI (UPF0317 family)
MTWFEPEFDDSPEVDEDDIPLCDACGSTNNTVCEQDCTGGRA